MWYFPQKICCNSRVMKTLAPGRKRWSSNSSLLRRRETWQEVQRQEESNPLPSQAELVNPLNPPSSSTETLKSSLNHTAFFPTPMPLNGLLHAPWWSTNLLRSSWSVISSVEVSSVLGVPPPPSLYLASVTVQYNYLVSCQPPLFDYQLH